MTSLQYRKELDEVVEAGVVPGDKQACYLANTWMDEVVVMRNDARRVDGGH